MSERVLGPGARGTVTDTPVDEAEAVEATETTEVTGETASEVGTVVADSEKASAVADEDDDEAVVAENAAFAEFGVAEPAAKRTR